MTDSRSLPICVVGSERRSARHCWRRARDASLRDTRPAGQRVVIARLRAPPIANRGATRRTLRAPDSAGFRAARRRVPPSAVSRGGLRGVPWWETPSRRNAGRTGHNSGAGIYDEVAHFWLRDASSPRSAGPYGQPALSTVVCRGEGPCPRSHRERGATLADRVSTRLR